MNPLVFPSGPATGSVKPADGERWAALDGLRGVAILAVLGVHGHHRVLPGGHFGVDLFFVLSGFLITSLLIRERQAFGSISLVRFYQRRALRLLPPLLVMLAVAWLGTCDYGTREDLNDLNKDIVSVLLYFYNWRAFLSPAPHPQTLGHLWSLSVEEQFYLIWPAVLTAFLAWGVRRRWLMVLALLGTILPTVLPFAVRLVDLPAWAGFLAVFPSVQRIYDLPIGCLLALLASSGVRPTRPAMRRTLQVAGGTAFAALLVHFVYIEAPWKYTQYAGFLVSALCGATVIASLLWAPVPPLKGLLEWQPLVWVGRISYATYLWNVPLVFAVHWLLGGRHPITTNALTWGCSLAAGALSYYYVELPFLRLRHHLERRPAQPALAVPSARAA